MLNSNSFLLDALLQFNTLIEQRKFHCFTSVKVSEQIYEQSFI